MLIGEVTRKTGLSRDTIRFYEKQGLITTSKKNRRLNNYKDYTLEMVEKIFTVKLLKSFGFTLNECKEIFNMIEADDATCNNLSEKFEGKIKLMDEKISDMIKIRSMLINGASKCKSGCNPLKPEDICQVIVPVKKLPIDI